MQTGKKIAVIIRNRQSEALRMGIGLSILHNVDFYLLDRHLTINNEISQSLDMIKELKLCVYTNNAFNTDMQYMPTEAIAERLLEYDSVIPY
ncbi:MAG: hypothetical protein KG029_00945 [Bacteroidetes bacterium]|nr:hypothetical protein [Bacteroidota bacterium]